MTAKRYWLVAHECGALLDDPAELLVSRGINVAKLLELAPDGLAKSLPFLGLGHRCLLQYTLARRVFSLVCLFALARVDALLLLLLLLLLFLLLLCLFFLFLVSWCCCYCCCAVWQEESSKLLPAAVAAAAAAAVAAVAAAAASAQQ